MDLPHAPACEMCMRLDSICNKISFTATVRAPLRRPLRWWRRTARTGRSRAARSGPRRPPRRRSRSRSGVAWGPVRRAGIAGVARAEKRLASGVSPRFRARQTIAHVFGGRRDVTQRPRAVHDPVERLCDLCLSSQVPVAHRPLRYRSRISKLYRLRDQKSAGPGKQ